MPNFYRINCGWKRYGELTAGSRSGRQNDQEITICDLTGVGVQDTTIAVLTYQKAISRGLGISFEV